MATVYKRVEVNADAAEVWDALRDWTALHTRLARGFITDLEVDGDDRIITLFNGARARERLITRDDERRRLVWTVVDGPYTHHNGVAHVETDEDGRTYFVWTADLLPDELHPHIDALMGAGIDAIKKTLESGQTLN